jgi:hypothetical protein
MYSVMVTAGPVIVRVCLRVRVIRLGFVGSSVAAGVLSVGEPAAGVLSALTAALFPDEPEEADAPLESPATISTSMHEVYISTYDGSTAVSFVKSQTQ